jgi:hypothetical protein
LSVDPMGTVSVRESSLVHRVPPPHPNANLRLISRMMRLRPNTMPSSERESRFVSIDEPFSAAFRMRGGLES